MGEFESALFGKAKQMLEVSEKNWEFISFDIFRESLNLCDHIYVVDRLIVPCEQKDCRLAQGVHIFLHNEKKNQM